ncbi:membrane protein [Secundilactobacillus pentosiphilus]|uniref:Membrane protein n=1 Tax=Secundilactobacillus pentosiphilus TaxID=1714682 RepID=A0A1Z5IVX3_9LACO|nr:DUF805 domain-containing protein [Secundilactobacillus pentosiphilus]GAX05934.1 membrane protein [Secundilactobacillus pentosiphilus]
MIQDYTAYWSKMTVFNATATRKQYWTAYIVNALVIWLYAALTHQTQYLVNGHYEIAGHLSSAIFGLILVLVWLANFTIRARRLHDSNHSNWWLLISMIPIIGTVWLFILLVMPTVVNQRWPLNQSQVQ